jgi:hypothetical protein
MANAVSNIDETTSLEERHYWCAALIEQGWDERSALEVTGLSVRMNPHTNSRECYISNPNPNFIPKGVKPS